MYIFNKFPGDAAVVSRDHTWRNIALYQQILTECLRTELYLLYICCYSSSVQLYLYKLADGGLIPNLPITPRMAWNASLLVNILPTTLGIFLHLLLQNEICKRKQSMGALHPTTAMCEGTGCTLYNSDVIMPTDK